IKGEEDESLIVHGNSFTEDGHADRKFDYMLANPPFGVEWKMVKDYIEAEAKLGHAGRFGVGLPRINDGSFLSFNTCSRRCAQSSRAAQGWPSSSTARRCSPAAPSRANRRSAAGFWKTIGSK